MQNSRNLIKGKRSNNIALDTWASSLTGWNSSYDSIVSNKYRLTSATNAYGRRDVFNLLDLTKYYLITVYGTNNSDTDGAKIRLYNNGVAIIKDSSDLTKTQSARVGLIVQPSELTGTTPLLYCYHYGSGYAEFSQFFIQEITSAEYALGLAPLMAKYPYISDSTTLADVSRNNNNGTLSGGATWIKPSGLPYMLDFTSATSICTIAKNASINDLTAFTIRGQFEYIGTGGSNAGRLFSKGANKELFIDSTNNRLQFNHGFSTTIGSWNTPTNSLVVGNLYTYQVTFDNTNVANNPVIILNGVSQTLTESSTPVGTASVDNAADLIIGNMVSANRHLNGYMSEVSYMSGIETVASGIRFHNSVALQYGLAKV